MSCDTLNVGAVQLDVSLASLPEGFCPASMQELGNAIASRLIISPSTEFNTFAIGSTAPASNVGPWLKDCLSWFVFDDSTASYVPITKGGFDSLEFFTSSTTFVVPAFIYKLKIHAWGAGGGGSNTTGGPESGSGGGGGAYGLSIVDVTPGQSIALVVGTGGATGATGSNGGATTILGMSAGGGVGAGPLISDSGDGGTATGFTVNLSGQGGSANSGGVSNQTCSGGDAGGWGGKGGQLKSNTVSRAGTSPGGGGSGGSAASSSAGGAGANGAICIEY